MKNMRKGAALLVLVTAMMEGCCDEGDQPFVCHSRERLCPNEDESCIPTKQSQPLEPGFGFCAVFDRDGCPVTYWRWSQNATWYLAGRCVEPAVFGWKPDAAVDAGHGD